MGSDNDGFGGGPYGGMFRDASGSDGAAGVDAALRAANNSLRADVESLRSQLRAVTEERDAYKKAKSENDDRFMAERDEARAERDRLRAQLAVKTEECEKYRDGWRTAGYRLAESESRERAMREALKNLCDVWEVGAQTWPRLRDRLDPIFAQAFKLLSPAPPAEPKRCENECHLCDERCHFESGHSQKCLCDSHPPGCTGHEGGKKEGGQP